jgi:hypothetical protein
MQGFFQKLPAGEKAGARYEPYGSSSKADRWRAHCASKQETGERNRHAGKQ